jgi:hypothetical protein
MTLELKEKTIVMVTSTTTTEKYGKESGSTESEENETTPDSTGPDMTDNRNSNGDVVLPHRYQKNGWDVEFDLDITERVRNGLFLLKIIPYSTPNGAMPETKLVLRKMIGGKTNFNIYNTEKNTFLPLSKATSLDLKQNFLNRNLEYNISNWGDNSYLYMFVKGHYSGAFYIFPYDTGGNYIRT